MPITILAGDNMRSSHILRNMFEARKRVFVDLLRWDIPVIDDRFEIDQFDDYHATYLILTDAGGGHLASCRLLPTQRPHILETLFPGLCDGPIPQGPDIYEITRFCLDRSVKGAERRKARNRLVSAIADYALQHGITSYTGVAEPGWFEQIKGFGWDCKPIGTVQQIGGHRLIGLHITIDARTIAALGATGIYSGDDAGLALAEAA